MLVYKSSGVFNFAQGEFGTVALYALYLLDFETSYWLAFLGALVAAVPRWASSPSASSCVRCSTPRG